MTESDNIGKYSRGESLQLAAAIRLVAEAQQFPGAREVINERTYDPKTGFFFTVRARHRLACHAPVAALDHFPVQACR